MSTHLVPVADDYSPSLRYSPFRRRLRATLIVFIISALAFVGVIRVYFDPIKANMDRMSGGAHADRPYPPLTRIRHEQEEPLPPSLPPPRPQELHIQIQAHSNKSPQSLLRLSPSEELGAVVAYLTSLGANAMIPPSIDPSTPVDPDLILGFNTRSPRAREEVKALMADTWAANPVVVISESRQPASRTVKAVLDDLNLQPMPVEIDVDLRSDGERLRKLMYRLTSFNSLPIVLIGGRAIGTLKDFERQHSSGQLQKRITAAGASILANKFKKRK